jgi:hypothetical protein
MGEEISRSEFEAADFARFDARLAEETALLAEMYRANRLDDAGYVFGFEIEAWLLDHAYFPHSVNEAFLRTLNHPLVVPELSRFNVELNSVPLRLRGDALLRAEMELERLWDRCNHVAHDMDANMVMIGTLPTIRDEDLSLGNISPLKRYYALNHEVLRRRGGRPIRVDIAGRDHLVTEHGDVMLEAATTSFQVHLQPPAALAHRFYNASLVLSGPLLAACGNAPFLFGRSLWEETRIPLFEQAVALGGTHAGSRRVTFGEGYLRASVLECFEENLAEYPVLLPLAFAHPPGEFHHLRLHNGTIWRWNRPLLGFGEDGRPHVRIEHRILPAGPSLLDMMANAAAYLGLAYDLVHEEADETLGLSFEAARRNFYAAAREGLGARLEWPGAGTLPARDLLLDELLPRAARGLARLDIDEEDSARLMGVLRARVSGGGTGAAWQQACFIARGRDFRELMATYCERQRSRAPVHEWDV